MLALALLTLALVAQDPVRVSATLSTDRVQVGAPVTLRITVETRGEAPDAVTLPDLPDGLDVIGTSDFSQTMISAPGGRSRATRREVIIVARRPGVFRIPPATIDVAGRRLRTAPLDLVVTAGSIPQQQPPPMAGRGWRLEEDVPTRSTLRMWLRPDTVYVGQQVLLHAEATFGDDARGRQSRAATFDPPAPAGFWIQDVPNPVAVALRVREGRTIETQTFRRAYFPLDAGSFTIPPARLYYEARRGFLSAPETRQITSDSARLVVLPLPERGRPAGFSGAVGRLSLRASVSPDRISAGEAALVTVELEGAGNVKALPEPRLPDLEHTDVYAPTQESTVEVIDLTVSGTKRFRWVVVPRRPGTLEIPPIEYSVFDPELRQYVTLRTEPLRIEAAAVAGVEVQDTAPRPLRVMPGREPAGWARSGAFAALQVMPVLILALAVVVRRRREAPPGPRDHFARVHATFAALRSRDDAAMLAELERVLLDAAVNVAGAAPDDPVASLRQQGRPGVAYALAGLLREISRVRFSPEQSPGARRQLLDRAEDFLVMVEPRRTRRTWRAHRFGALLLFLAAGAVGHGAPVMGQTPAFEAGLARYRAGDFAAAATAFHEYALAHPRDPNGWYNLGLAARAAGDDGRAAWAWLRATRLAPRDADLRHNLERVGGLAAARQVRPPDLLAPAERLALAAAGWWLLILGVGLRLARRPGAAWSGGAGAAILLLAAAAAFASAARPVALTPLGDGAPLHAGPSIHDEQAGRLTVGSLARLVEDRGDWLRVRLEHGREAWVERRTVAAP